MRKSLTFLCLLLIAAIPSLPADGFGELGKNDSVEPTPEKLNALIKQLGSGRFPTREKASKDLSALSKLHPSVLIPHLNEAADSKDPEVSRRAMAIRENLRDYLSQQTVFIGTRENKHLAMRNFVRCKLNSTVKYPQWSYCGLKWDVLDIHIRSAEGCSAVCHAPVSLGKAITDNNQILNAPLPQNWSGICVVDLPSAEAKSIKELEVSVLVRAPTPINARYFVVKNLPQGKVVEVFADVTITVEKFEEKDELISISFVLHTCPKDIKVQTLIRDQKSAAYIPGPSTEKELLGPNNTRVLQVKQDHLRQPGIGAAYLIGFYQLAPPENRYLTFSFSDFPLK